MLFKGRILRQSTLESKNDGKKNGNHHCTDEQELNHSSESKVTQHRHRVSYSRLCFEQRARACFVLFIWFDFHFPLSSQVKLSK